MSTTAKYEIRFVDNMVCEINTLKKGEVSCANKILFQRIEAMDRLDAMQCLIEANDSSYDDIIDYLFQQVKEMALKLTIKTY